MVGTNYGYYKKELFRFFYLNVSIALIYTLICLIFKIGNEMPACIHMFVLGMLILRDYKHSINYERGIKVLGVAVIFNSLIFFINYLLKIFDLLDYSMILLSLVFLPHIYICYIFVSMIWHFRTWYLKYLVIDLVYIVIVILSFVFSFFYDFVNKLQNSRAIVFSNFIFVMFIVNTVIIYMMFIYKVKYIDKFNMSVRFVIIFPTYLFLVMVYVIVAGLNNYLFTSMILLLLVVGLAIINGEFDLSKKISPLEFTNDIYIFYKIASVKKVYIIQLLMVLIISIISLSYFRLISIRLAVFLVVFTVVYQLISKQISTQVVSGMISAEEEKQKASIERILNTRNKELIENNETLDFYSTHDRLTKKPTRELFLIDIKKMYNNSQVFSIVLVSVDNLRLIRSLYGIGFSNKIIDMFLEKLNAMTLDGDKIYRISSDEFAVVTNNTGDEYYENFYGRLKVLSDFEFKNRGLKVNVVIKFGALECPRDISRIDNIFKDIDMQSFLYNPASTFKKQHQVHLDEIEKVNEKKRIASLLKEVDFDEEFQVYYQPQFDIVTKALIGAEALLRWKKGDKFISPGLFIPIAEETGDIGRISVWVCHTVVRSLLQWKDTIGDEEFKIGVNISPVILNNDNFIDDFFRYTEKLKYTDFQLLDFELTEQSDLQRNSDIILRLNRISSKNIDLSIDDFGTGYSSIQNLSLLNINRVKIPKELVDNIENDGFERALVASIINMCKASDITTIAEGVETVEQVEVLRMLQCDQVQGYVWGKPMPKRDFENKFYLL